jgi:L-amino acid N-acyltransferase YncA
MDFDIRTMRSADWPVVRSIYSEGIATGNATFETEIPEWSRWDQSHLQDCRLIAQHSEQILGWAAQYPAVTFIPAWQRFRFTWLPKHEVAESE